MYTDVTWMLWVVGGAFLVVAGYMSSSLSNPFGRGRYGKKDGVLKDSPEFRMVLREWETFVVRERGTIRAVKRFANRARFLTGGRGNENGEIDVESLVGFVALEECGRLDANAHEFNFAQWREELAGEKVCPRGWVENTGGQQWEAYRRLVAGRTGWGAERDVEGEGGGDNGRGA